MASAKAKTDGKVVELASRRKRQPAEPQPATDTAEQAAATSPVQVVLLLTVDGQPRHHIAFEARSETPEPGKGVGIAFPVDARALAQLLEQVVGPTAASAAKPKLWTPGA